MRETLFIDYFKATGCELVLEDDGFIVYKINGRECFIAEMSTRAEKRGSGVGKRLIARLSEIAKDAGCDCLSGNIRLQDPGANNTLIASLATGFKLIRAENNVLLISMDLTGE